MLVRSLAVRKRPKKEKFRTDLEHFFSGNQFLGLPSRGNVPDKNCFRNYEIYSDIYKDFSFLHF